LVAPCAFHRWWRGLVFGIVLVIESSLSCHGFFPLSPLECFCRGLVCVGCAVSCLVAGVRLMRDDEAFGVEL
jgi:hypothetical protein